MKNWESTLIAPATSLREALSIIDNTGRQMAIVVDQRKHLIGTLSDGDIRRWLIGGGTIDDLVDKVCNRNPITASASMSTDALIGLMRTKGIRQVPLVDGQNTVTGLSTVDDYLQCADREEPVVIMAGGLGSRMGMLTREKPKPMLPIAGRPILELIIEQFRNQGFRQFYLAVNYLGEQILSHFGDGTKFDVRIEYLEEKTRLGTAGALSLLPDKPETSLVVTNGDLLLKEDFSIALDRHIEQSVDLTVLARDYQMQVPFGVIDEVDGVINAIVEKPVHTFKVNAGIYFLEPKVLDLVPSDTFFDMPELFNQCVSCGMSADRQLLNGYWLDIGQPMDYQRAQNEFSEIFQ